DSPAPETVIVPALSNSKPLPKTTPSVSPAVDDTLKTPPARFCTRSPAKAPMPAVAPCTVKVPELTRLAVTPQPVALEVTVIEPVLSTSAHTARAAPGAWNNTVPLFTNVPNPVLAHGAAATRLANDELGTVIEPLLITVASVKPGSAN